jgi:hypothetical protein
MKKLLLIVICFISLQLFAQGNLQFNQVLNVMKSTNFSSGTGGGVVISSSFTVPTGKVWKIEGLYQGVTFVGAASGSQISYIIDPSANLNLMKSNASENILWLPAGTYAIRFSWGCGSASCSGTVYNTVNAIEFNIIP